MSSLQGASIQVLSIYDCGNEIPLMEKGRKCKIEGCGRELSRRNKLDICNACAVAGKTLARQPRERYLRENTLFAAPPDKQQVIDAVCKEFSVDLNTLRKNPPVDGTLLPRQALMYLLRVDCALAVADIADITYWEPTSISSSVHRVEVLLRAEDAETVENIARVRAAYEAK